MATFISRELDKPFLQTRPHPSSESGARGKSNIDLTLDKYAPEQVGSKAGEATMDVTFKNASTCQISTFFFAGHDNSSLYTSGLSEMGDTSPYLMSPVLRVSDDLLRHDPQAVFQAHLC